MGVQTHVSNLLCLVILLSSMGLVQPHWNRTDPQSPKTHPPYEWPNCDVDVNPNLSPLNIMRANLEPSPNDTRTLMIYSGDPINKYMLSDVYVGPEEGNKSRPILNILNMYLSQDTAHGATYVGGLGQGQSADNRMFSRALFLFSKSFPTHQIDGKTYPLEIVFLFYSEKTTKLHTQLSVLVKFQKEHNPLWFPVLRAVKRLSQMPKKSDVLSGLQKELESATEERDTCQAQHDKNVAENMDSGSLKQLLKVVFPIHEELSKIKEERKNIQYKEKAEIWKYNRLRVEQNLRRARYYKDTYTKQRDTLKEKLDKQIVELRQTKHRAMREGPKKLTEFLLVTQARSGTPLHLGPGQFEERVFGYIRNNLAELEKYFHRNDIYMAHIENTVKGPHNVRMNVWSQSLNASSKENDILWGKMKENGVGQGLKFENISKIADRMEESLELEKKLGRAKRAIDEINREIDDLKGPEGLGVKIHKFQASWLFPDTGGYYYYPGSLVIPACDQMIHTLVFAQKIGISEEQFENLSSIMDVPNNEPELRNQAMPPLALQDPGPRKVFHNKKRIQYELDDGVHMKTIDLIRLEAKLKNGVPDFNFHSNFRLFAFVITLFLLN